MITRSESRSGMAMAAPAILGLIIFIALPFILATCFSFTNLRLGSPLPTEFVGWEQFRRILASENFRHALINNALFALFVVPIQTIIALGLALLLNQKIKGISFFRTIFFMPVVFPMALLAVVWQLIYAPGPNGFMNSFLSFITFGAWQAKDFLHDPYLALPSIMLLSIWQGAGFQMVILLAGLQHIPEHLYEAAKVDGAGPFARFFSITLPLLRPTLLFLLVVLTIGGLNAYISNLLITNGGDPLDLTHFGLTLMYEATFTKLEFGYGSAISYFLTGIVFIVSVAQIRLLRQRVEF